MLDYNGICRDMEIQPQISANSRACQSAEGFSAIVDGTRTNFKMHDYPSMYRVPGLYDAMMFGMLGCRTPALLAKVVEVCLEASAFNGSIRMLEIGAGSGAFAEQIRRRNFIVERLVGLDIHEEARSAAERDRPGVYDDYLICDLTRLDRHVAERIKDLSPNCVAVASATGWGNHIPVAGFQAAFDHLSDQGWFVFHVKPNDPDPECIALNEWITQLIASGSILNPTRGRIFHRENVDGNPIFYDYIVGQKA
ncbi:methyltransferase domain-containing protein [Salinisphaera japonica]|uniref:methyltransferase domain-containing protein n=1 Tax=Salinisphaera japonica TaxID=1304270 RepID=UPI000F4CF844|nr:methyltransferase domain-containing protein [Salinisphaera japonica]